MTKSPGVQRLNELQLRLSSLLKPLGFRKLGRVYNREPEADLVQVIALQAGPYEIGAGTYGQASLYGSFTVNLGIRLGECQTKNGVYPDYRGRSVSDADCTIRSRLSWLENGEDRWLSLGGELDEIHEVTASGLLNVGLPFLDRFGTRDLILAEFEKNGPSIFFGAGKVEAAMIEFHRGNRSKAGIMLREHIAASTDHRGHQEYIRDLALKLGFNDLE